MNTDLDQLRTAIDSDRAALCVALGLRKYGKRFFCHCQCDGAPHADGDLSVEAGFRCHKCGWKGDGFDLIQKVKGYDFPAAVEFARSVYAISNGTAPTKAKTTTRKEAKIHPKIEEAESAALWSTEQQTGFKWEKGRRDMYQNAEVMDVAAVLRFDRTDGARDADGKIIKTFRPIHAVESGWKTGDPSGQWPLFNLPAIMANTETVFDCEGEKAACAGNAIGLICTTSAHGAKSPQKTDWTPLAGRAVVIIPDHDRAGRDYAEKVAVLCHAAGAKSVRIVELPGLPKKGDVADFVALRNGQTLDAIRAEILKLVDTTPAWEPPKRETPPELPSEDEGGTSDPVQSARAGRPYSVTDLGNAERLVALHGDSFRWDVARRVWRVWDGRRWAVDSALQVYRFAADTARTIRKEAVAAPSSDGHKDIAAVLFKWAVKSEARDRLQAMIEVAKSRPGIAIAADLLDVDPWALNVLNGTIDLRTGELRPHNRADLITKLAPVEYRPGHCDERFNNFLRDATGDDADVIAFLQVVCGYTLTGDTSEEKLFLVYGPEATGKTTLLEALRATMGEYARIIQADLLTRQRESRGGGAASPELAGLAGARMAAGSEMEQGREIAEALAKNLTGGETITARPLYAEFFDFKPQFKVWLALNHCPKVSADDGAIWRRILRIGFAHTVPPERRDKTLKPYLRDPQGGAVAVLAWAVAGCLRWQREGLRVPDAVARSTAAYRQESDPLAIFIEDCLTFNPAAWTSWPDIWAAYNIQAEEAGTPER
jgi:putative DNA primase/helicase